VQTFLNARKSLLGHSITSVTRGDTFLAAPCSISESALATTERVCMLHDISFDFTAQVIVPHDLLKVDYNKLLVRFMHRTSSCLVWFIVLYLTNVRVSNMNVSQLTSACDRNIISHNITMDVLRQSHVRSAAVCLQKLSRPVILYTPEMSSRYKHCFSDTDK